MYSRKLLLNVGRTCLKGQEWLSLDRS